MKWIICENKDPNKMEIIKRSIQNKIPVFIFMFLEGCGPCNSTKGSWDENKEFLESKYRDQDFVVARINQVNKDYLNNIGTEPMGYPSLRYIDSNGKVQEYEDSGIQPTDRSSISFQKWVESKLNEKHHLSKKNIEKHSKAHLQKGGKWSAKYKKSINCKRPKGFSQKQYCRYGKNRRNSKNSRNSRNGKNGKRKNIKTRKLYKYIH